MGNDTIECVKRFLDIEEYPGNLFQLFQNTEDLIKKKKIILFKEDIDELSGFIGYNGEYTIICINNNRNIGHQNFTLAHELGHRFLHFGISKSDENPEGSGGGIEEKEANDFAKELLYPSACVQRDIKYVFEYNLLIKKNWSKLAEYINSLCCKYYTSFIFTFNRLLESEFETFQERKNFYKNFKKKEIGRFDDRFPETAFMHNVKEEHEFYKVDYEPYKYMKKIVANLVSEYELGFETGEAMIERYRELEG